MTGIICANKDAAPRPAPPGIGLDAEQVARFEKFAAGESPWRLVYSAREAAHLAAQPQSALAFCAAFCCKEAFCKALGESYSFPQLVCLYRAGAFEQEVVLPQELKERHGIEGLRVRFDEQFLQERGEYVVEVYLIRAGKTFLESLPVAAVAAERERIERDHFSPRELADLGNRRIQSLAGFLSLKRALVRMWAGAETAVAIEPRDFELGHHESGAPRLVAAPAGLSLADVFISISHTRQWAYGLAATRRRGRHACGGAPHLDLFEQPAV